MITPIRSLLAAVLVSFTASCTTAYDAYGRPQTVVTPGGALLGTAAVGLLAYGLASSDDDDNCNNNRYRGNNYSSYRNNGYRSYQNNSCNNGSNNWGHHHRGNW